MNTIIKTDRVRLFHNDCIEVMQALKENSVDAIVTDPPYGLEFMGKGWDKLEGGDVRQPFRGETQTPDNPFGRTPVRFGYNEPNSGAKQQAWHFAWCVEALRVLKPGGHMLAFGGTRTYHRMTCAIEDAGFEIRDSLHWMYGTGFPKSLNLGDGYGTALKPAHEPIVLARKPLIGTVAANVAEHGTGAINIDACRIPTDDNLNGGEGRWPANVLLDEDAAAELDAQSGVLTSGTGAVKRASGAGYAPNALGKESRPVGTPMISHGGSGGASRFFYVAKPSRKERDYGCGDLIVRSGGEMTDREDGSAGLNSPRAGAGRAGGARNIHPTVKPIELMSYLTKLITPTNGWVFDPFVGSATTGIAALLTGYKFIGCERELDYIQIAKLRLEQAIKDSSSV